MKNNELSRRTFLKRTGAASATVAVAGMVPAKAHAAIGAWTNGKAINPNIDNLKVVCCHDMGMLSGSYVAGFSGQNSAVNTGQVEKNMDKMAMELSGKSTASEAWTAVFRKPSGKQWSQVRCALKANCINTKNMPRVAVVGKICKELIALGVPAAGIVIYDGCHNAGANGKYKGYVGSGLPTGVVVSNTNGSLGGAKKPASLPTYATVPSGATCTADLVDNKIDILVNLAVNKHHGGTYGSVTMCLKNHFGTYHPRPDGHGDNKYLIAINKSNEVLGGDPVRQQLCIIDSLWGSHSGGPGETPTGTATGPARLIMGTFAPAVDYLTATASWSDWKSAGGTQLKHATNANTQNFLIEFGYTAAQRDALAFTAVSPYIAPTTPEMKLSEENIEVTGIVGNQMPVSRILQLTNSGTGQLAKATSTVAYEKGSGWITAQVGGSGNSQTISNLISMAGLSSGEYRATVTVVCSGASNSPQSYTVKLTVKPVGIRVQRGRTALGKRRPNTSYTITGRRIKSSKGMGRRFLKRGGKGTIRL